MCMKNEKIEIQNPSFSSSIMLNLFNFIISIRKHIFRNAKPREPELTQNIELEPECIKDSKRAKYAIDVIAENHDTTSAKAKTMDISDEISLRYFYYSIKADHNERMIALKNAVKEYGLENVQRRLKKIGQYHPIMLEDSENLKNYVAM